jgi:hypothetical protein
LRALTQSLHHFASPDGGKRADWCEFDLLVAECNTGRTDGKNERDRRDRDSETLRQRYRDRQTTRDGGETAQMDERERSAECHYSRDSPETRAKDERLEVGETLGQRWRDRERERDSKRQ